MSGVLKISAVFLGKLLEKGFLLDLHQTRFSGILLQRGIAICGREAAALPGRFLPELGRSHERPFFLARSFAPCVRRGLLRRKQNPWAKMMLRSRRLATSQKS
jgi:hypothetical protein